MAFKGAGIIYKIEALKIGQIARIQPGLENLAKGFVEYGGDYDEAVSGGGGTVDLSATPVPDCNYRLTQSRVAVGTEPVVTDAAADKDSTSARGAYNKNVTRSQVNYPADFGAEEPKGVKTTFKKWELYNYKLRQTSVDAPEPTFSFGELIKRIRLRQGMSQLELAKQIGITRQMLQQVEGGRKAAFTGEKLRALQRALKLYSADRKRLERLSITSRNMPELINNELGLYIAQVYVRKNIKIAAKYEADRRDWEFFGRYLKEKYGEKNPSK